VSRVGGACKSGLVAAELVLPHAHTSEELARVEGASWRNQLADGAQGRKERSRSWAHGDSREMIFVIALYTF
jgi:hypothetical protein